MLFLYDISETYDKTEINALSNNFSSNSFLIGNLTITSNTSFNTTSSNTNLINNLNSTMTTKFNNISSSSNLLSTNFNNISSTTHSINNKNSTTTSYFNNISSNTNFITGLNSAINSHFTAISDLQNGGSFNEADYYNKIATNNLLSDKLETSILNSTLIQNITTTSSFKIVEFGNYNYYHELYNNCIDTYVYGSLTGATMFLNQRGFGDVEINNSSTFQNKKNIKS